ncbi:MAG: hypothetical protein WBF53_02980 [Litorimonas sp.]
MVFLVAVGSDEAVPRWLAAWAPRTVARIEVDARVGLAIDRYGKGGPGFSDQMIRAAAGEAGCEALASFDRQVAALEGGFVPQ